MEIHIPPVKRLHASSDNNTQYVLSLYVQFISCVYWLVYGYGDHL